MEDTSKEHKLVTISKADAFSLHNEIEQLFGVYDRTTTGDWCYSGDFIKEHLPKTWELFNKLGG